MSMLMTRTDPHTNPEEPRWGVRLEMNRDRSAYPRRSGRKPERFRGLRIFVMSTFILHGIVYAVIMAMLFLINLLTWDGMLWMIFPAIGWGAFLGIHGGIAWLTANAGVSNRMVDRARQPVAMPNPRSNAKANTPAGELEKIVMAGLNKVDEMRAIGRHMSTPSARRNALIAVSSIENTLLALENQVDELPLAREFSGSFLEPAHKIFVEYDRLSRRDIQSAKALLQDVEQKDLPRITERAEQVHERVHRGTMIDLQVAREMLHLGTGDEIETALNRTSS